MKKAEKSMLPTPSVDIGDGASNDNNPLTTVDAFPMITLSTADSSEPNEIHQQDQQQPSTSIGEQSES